MGLHYLEPSKEEQERRARLSALADAQSKGTDKAVDFQRTIATTPDTIQDSTNGPFKPFHQKGLGPYLALYKGAEGLDTFLQKAMEQGEIKTKTHLLQHPFEIHSTRRNEWLDVTGEIDNPPMSIASFAARVHSDLLGLIAEKGKDLKNELVARVYMLAEEQGRRGHNIYYQLGLFEEGTTLFAGGAKNLGQTFNLAREYCNAIMGLVQMNTGVPVEIVKVSNRFGMDYQALIEDRIAVATRKK